MNILKVSCHGNFTVTQLAKNIAICEATEDRHGWDNAEEGYPAFLVYLGCPKDEVEGWIKTLNKFWRCCWCEVRSPKYLKEYSAEIKIRGMQRFTDDYAYGLDYLVESQTWWELEEELGCSTDEYDYYATGVMQRW